MSLENLVLPLDHLTIETVELNGSTSMVTASSVRPRHACPVGHTQRERVHRRYRRTVADLPWADHRLVLHVHVHRCFCDQAQCPKRTFAERFGAALPPYARRTARLTARLTALGFAPGGHGAARRAQVLAMPISPRPALRIIHRHPLPDTPTPRVVGIDDWAWKQGRTDGAICVDLERHQPIDLLPDREPTTIAAWLHAHPTVDVVARDRGGTRIDGIGQGAPHAVQGADRWHVLKHLGEAGAHLFHHHSPLLQQVVAELEAHHTRATTSGRPAPTLDGARHTRRTTLARAAWSGRARERYHQMHTLHAEQIDSATIARHLHLSRPMVYR